MKQKQMQYHEFLENKLKNNHLQYHILERELQAQKKNNSKLLNQISSLRKKQNDSKLEGRNMKKKIQELQMIVNSYKNPPKKKQALQTVNTINKKKEQIDQKQAFKDFLAQNYPKYKSTVKKILSMILFFERHWNKTNNQRIAIYHKFIGQGIHKIVQRWFPNPTSLSNISKMADKNDNIAQSLINKWQGTDSKMKQIMRQRNTLKLKQNHYLTRIQELQTSQATLLSAKKGLQAKNYSLQFTLKTKALQFSLHLKKLLLNKHDVIKEDYQIDEEQYKKYSEEIETVIGVMNRVLKHDPKNQKNIIIQEKPQKQQNLKENEKNRFAIHKKQSTKKGMCNAPVLKKNIYGYYEDPQFFNPPLLTKTISVNNVSNKYIQTTPEDLTIMTKYPILLLNIIDGKIRSIPQRHRLDFYVKICNNDPDKPLNSNISQKFVCSQPQSGLQPIWNQKLLIRQYNFPFLFLQLMNMSKLSLKDDIIGNGKMQIADKNSIKEISIRDSQKQYQGKVRLQLSYPKCSVYLFTVNSIQIVYPDNVKILNETVVLSFPFNPTSAICFQPGQKFKYLNHQVRHKHIGNKKFPNHYQFLIMPNYVGEQNQNKLKVSLLQNKKKGLKTICNNSTWTQENADNSFFCKTIKINMKNSQWAVILKGSVITLVSQKDQPQKIEQETDQELTNENMRKYFSIIAPTPIIQVKYNQIVLPSHIKMPLVFRLADDFNSFILVKATQRNTNNQNITLEQKIEPITNDGNVIASSSIERYPSLRAPKIVYKIYLQTIEASSKIMIHNNQYYYQKMLQKLDLSILMGKQVKKFSIFTNQLVQNYFITFSKMIDRQFIKFRLGYTKFENILKMPGFKEIQQKYSESQEVQSDKQTSTADPFVTLTIKDGRVPSFGSTSDYQIIFKPAYQQHNKNILSKISKSTNGRPTWNQKIVLPYEKKMKLQVIEYPLIGHQKVIYQNSQFQIKEVTLKLQNIFVNIMNEDGQVRGDYILFEQICNLPELYRAKVSKIHAQIDQKADWIGQIDPYIKIYDPHLEQQLYQTQSLDGKGNSPVWNNDQFQTIVASSQLQCNIYDSDLIGKDDYLGITHLNIHKALQQKYNVQSKIDINLSKGISKYYVKKLSGLIRKEQKQCGQLNLFGQFKRIGGKDIKLTNRYLQSKNLQKIGKNGILKITAFSIKMNHQYLSNNMAYFEYQNQKQYYSKKSFVFPLIDNAPIDFSFWPKEYLISQSSETQIIIRLHENKKNLFNTQTILLGQCKFKIQSQNLKSHSVNFNKSQIILQTTQQIGKVIGQLYYCAELVYQMNYLLIQGSSILQIAHKSDMEKVGETICNRKKGACLLISDVGDCLTIGHEANQQIDELPKLVFFMKNWEIIHPNYQTNSTLSIQLQKKHTNYGELYKLLATPYDQLFGMILVHEFKLEQKYQIETLQTHSQNIVLYMTHFYFSQIQKPFFQKSGSEIRDKLKNIYIVFKNNQYVKGIINQTYKDQTQFSLINLLNCSEQHQYPSLIIKQLSQNLNYIDVQLVQKTKTTSKVIAFKLQMTHQKYQHNQVHVVSFGKCIKYQGIKFMLSCQFSTQPQNQKHQTTKFMHIKWTYLEIYPLIPYTHYTNMKRVLKSLKNSKNCLGLKIKAKNQQNWCKQFIIQAYGAQAEDDESFISNTLTMAINQNSDTILQRNTKGWVSGFPTIHNRSILLRELQIILPNSEIFEFYLIYGEKTKFSEFKLTELSLQQLCNQNCIVENQTIDCDKIDDIEQHGILQYNRFGAKSNYTIKKLPSSGILKGKQVTNMNLIEINQIVLNINHHSINKFHSSCFQNFIEIYIIQPETKVKTVCKLQFNPGNKSKNKQFMFKQVQNTYGNICLLPDLQQGSKKLNKEEYTLVQVWSGDKSQGLLGFMRKNQHIGVSTCFFNKNENHLAVQIKTVGKKQIVIGKLEIKYRFLYQSTNFTCEQISIDRILYENTRQLTYNSLQIRYFIASQDLQEQEQKNIQFMHILQIEPLRTQDNNSCQIIGNQTIFLMKVPMILLMMQKYCFRFNIYSYSVMSQKHSLLCSFKSNQLQLKITDNMKQRWSKQIKFGKITKMILSGYHQSQLKLIAGKQIENVQQINEETQKQFIMLKLSKFKHLCPNHSKLTLQIENAASSFQTKSLDFTTQQDFQANFILNKEVCDHLQIHILGQNKKMPIYTSQQIQIHDQKGISLFYVSNLIQNATPVLMGLCQWSLVPISVQPFQQNQAKLLLQITKISLQIFSDEQWFQQMNPYIQINNYFATTISIGKQQLFWNLKILSLLEDNQRSVYIQVKDKDMFYDDLIGISNLPYKDIITRYKVDKLQNIHKEQMRADIPVFRQKNKQQAVAHLKLHYKIYELTEQSTYLGRNKQIQNINEMKMSLSVKQIEQYLKNNNLSIYKNMKSCDQQIELTVGLANRKKQINCLQKQAQIIKTVSLNNYYSTNFEQLLPNIHFHLCFTHLNDISKQAFQLSACIKDKDKYSKKPLYINLNLNPPICSLSKYQCQNQGTLVILVLQQVKAIFNNPKFNRCDHNVVIEILTDYRYYTLIPNRKGCKGSISSSKYSPQILDMNTNYNASLLLNEKVVLAQLKKDGTNVLQIKYTISDIQTGFKSIGVIDLKLQPILAQTKVIMKGQIYQNYQPHKNIRNSQEIGAIYIITSMNTVKSPTNQQIKPLFDTSKNMGKNINGTQYIRIVLNSGTFYKDLEFFSKMDPYCQIYTKKGGQYTKIYRTHTQDNKGKNPVWNQSVFVDSDIEGIYFKILDEEMSVNRPIGDGYLPFNQKQSAQIITLYETQKQFKFNQNKQIGKLKIFLGRPTSFLISFTNIRYFNKSKSWSKSLQIFLCQTHPIDKLTNAEKVKMNKNYPLQMDLQTSIIFGLDSTLSNQEFLEIFSLQQIIRKCQKHQNQIILKKSEIILTYILVV